ncbi:hypothetical protein HL658_26370 [Azospirillum sp. RWY-5-1]|uniref:Uncharacterized protein n=1 Tax=Azospirillum oleiclasticum TaxID=2735135 RepID=A0ABX2TF47_9PROT|nr:hypothetical protein [Azospirillum oleiclasticum]NYZ16080.1 hypothetical protein [Azospirillum oleiclasticum]NYZ22961.1 hypothetical protein [Azospirillum oleiclasticum]
MTSTMTLDTFRIGIVGQNESYSNQLYANGNQQLPVFINIQKQVFQNNQWVAVNLSSSEAASLRVVQYSSSTSPALPPGWSMDTSRNQYDQGLRGSATRSLALPDAEDGDGEDTAPESRSAEMRGSWQVFYLYLRAGTTVTPVTDYQFMAYVRLDDGTVYTTHSTVNSKPYESKITVSPQRPYVIRVDEMLDREGKPKRDDAYTSEYSKGCYVDVDVYYWPLPSSLRVMSQEFSNMGWWSNKLAYPYDKTDDGLRIGAALKDGVTSLTLGDIGSMPSGVSGTTNVPIVNGAGLLRALRYSCTCCSKSNSYDMLMNWSVTDNLGCVSKFVLKANSEDKGNTLNLLNA